MRVLALFSTLFKGFVSQNRPTVDIDKVATGETWFGPDAVAQGLVDKLVTVDEVLLERVEAGAEVLGVTYQDKPKSPLAALAGAPGGQGLDGALLSLLTSDGGRLAMPAWKAAALSLVARALGAGGRGGGGGGALEYDYDARAPRGATSAFERQALLQARAAGEAEPMLRWRGDGDAGEEQERGEDSWFL